MLKYDINPKAKGLIFDLDGTLANTMPYHYEAWRSAAQEFGMEMSKDFLKSLMGGSATVIGQKLIALNNKTGEINTKDLLAKKTENYRLLIPQVTPIDEVYDIVKAYHGKIPMAIGTGGTLDSVNLTLKQTGIGEFFDILISAGDVKNHKPAPDTFLKCADLIGIDPQYCEVFEDGDPGIIAAERAGMIATDVRNWFEPKW